MGMRVEEFTSLEQCAPLQGQWNALVERAPNVTIFSTWEWQSTWWKHYGGNDQLRVLAAFESDRVVGLLPLYQTRRRLAPALSSREIRLLGAGGDTSPDYLGAVVDRGCERAAAAALAGALLERRSTWDVLNLTDMTSGVFLESLTEGLQATGVQARVSPCSIIQIAHLPDTWQEYLAAMHHDRRARVLRLRRGAVRKLDAQFRPPQNEAEVRAAVEDLISLHCKRWDSKDEPGAFRSASYVSFHREVIEKCHLQNWVRLYRLEVAGNTAAVLYCYRYRDEVLYFQSGFDPDLKQFSLGQVLIGLAIESAIGEGSKVFDLLKGEHPYKKSWSNDERMTFDLVAHNRSVLGQLQLLRRKLASVKQSALLRFGRQRAATIAEAH
jgi:CelD/BcsL family acetyltransferase involved in cellulose biosynthesis